MRKPSHFGSKIQPSPSGSEVASFASIGGIGPWSILYSLEGSRQATFGGSGSIPTGLDGRTTAGKHAGRMADMVLFVPGFFGFGSFGHPDRPLIEYFARVEDAMLRAHMRCDSPCTSPRQPDRWRSACAPCTPGPPS